MKKKDENYEKISKLFRKKGELKPLKKTNYRQVIGYCI